MDASLKVPAVFCNKFFVTVGPGGVRITFAETNPETADAIMRTSVLLPHGDAVALKELLERMLSGMVEVSQEDMKEIIQKAQANQPELKE